MYRFDQTNMKRRAFLLVFCYSAVFATELVTFNPDPDEHIQLPISSSLTPPLEIMTVQCYTYIYTYQGLLKIILQYVTTDEHEVLYNTTYRMYSFDRDNCGEGQGQYRVTLSGLRADPIVVGRTIRLKAFLDSDVGRSTLSRRTYNFPAAYNITGSSVSAVLNYPYTWTCHVTQDYPIIEWFKGYLVLGQVGSPAYANGSCLTHGQNISLNYKYQCQNSALTYTLTIPGSSMTEELQASTWRCRDAIYGQNGSAFTKLDIIVPVLSVTIYPGSRSTYTVDENQNVTFTCVMNNAYPAPTILWFLGSSDVTTQAGSNRTTLTFNATRVYHQVAVRCVGWNIGNTANTSDSTVLNIRLAAIFLTEQHYQVLHLNRAASINISFYCNPPVTLSGVEWINKTGLNDKPVETSKIISFSLSDGDMDLNLGKPSFTLRGQITFLNISSVQRYHRGYYVVKIQNSASLVSSLGVMLDVSDDKPDTFCTEESIDGIAGGITGAYIVLTAVLAVVIVLRERKYRIEKGKWTKQRKISFEGYTNVQPPNRSDERGATTEHSEDERPTYEDLQDSSDVHMYDHVELEIHA